MFTEKMQKLAPSLVAVQVILELAWLSLGAMVCRVCQPHDMPHGGGTRGSLFCVTGISTYRYASPSPYGDVLAPVGLPANM